jgi:hypothetical protein
MSGSDVSRDDDDLDEGQFSDADDEAVEVRISCSNQRTSVQLNCTFGSTISNLHLRLADLNDTHLADGLARGSR